MFVVRLVGFDGAVSGDQPGTCRAEKTEPYSRRLVDDEQRKCSFGNCDQRVIERLWKECSRNGRRWPNAG